MTRYPSLDAARAAAGQGIVAILLVECRDGSQTYICSRVSEQVFRTVTARSPHPEVARIVESYDVLASELRAAKQAELLASIPCRCERCGTDCKRETDYHQTERGRYGRVTAYYCRSCAQLLRAIGGGERSAMDERRSEQPDRTPSHKED